MIIGINAKWRLSWDPLNCNVQKYGGERKEKDGSTTPIWKTMAHCSDAWHALNYMVKHEIYAIEGEWDAGALDTLFPKLHEIQQLIDLFRERLEPITPEVLGGVVDREGGAGSDDTGAEDADALCAANSEEEKAA